MGTADEMQHLISAEHEECESGEEWERTGGWEATREARVWGGDGN